MAVVVRRYVGFLIILLFPTPLVLLFLQQHPYFFVHFVFSFLFMLFLCNIANVAQRIDWKSAVEHDGGV